MKRVINKYAFAIIILLCLITGQTFAQINTPAGATVPFGSNASYAYGIMPTLPSGGTYGKAGDIADKYNTWKSTYVENCGTDKARVRFDDVSQTVSEGIAYGMLLAAYAADKDLLNRLWAYYKQHRNNNGVMHWKISGCSNVVGQNGATDAELDAAMALIVANYQWPNTTSPHNYKTDAVALITAIKNTEINSSDYTFENGDSWKPACRNPSYQSPAYARVFKMFMAENGQANNTFWDNVTQKTEALLINNAHSTSGLPTNWCTPAGPPNSSCSGSGTAPDKFGYDACRAPWREATDYIWYGPSTIQTITNRQVAFWIGKGGAGNVRGGDGINHDGSGSGDHNAAFVGPIGALSLSASNTTANLAFCNAMYTENKKDALASGYFTKILQMIGLFVQTGNFWNPYGIASSTTTSIILTAPTLTTATEGDALTISATATATSGSISKVDFYVGTSLVGTDNTAPYSISWNINVSGNVSITAVATNTNNDIATTSEFTLSIYKAINQTNTAPLIDGNGADAVWGASNTSASLGNVISGAISGTSDLSANYKAVWDATYFYLLVNVTDDVKTNNAGTDTYNDDAVEVFFDIGNDKSATYGANDFQYTFRWNDNTVYERSNKIMGVTFAKTDNSTGYVMEMRFPWSTLTGTPAINQLVGFDVEVNDDDNGDTRDAKISWAATADQAWTNPSYMGTVKLKGASCISPSAAGVITGLAATCAGLTGVTYSIATVANATAYTWTLPAGATITAGANTNSITVTFGSTGGNVTVTPTNTCGNGAMATKAVAVTANVTPSVTTAASATTICAGTSVTFTATPTNGGSPSYQWRRNNANISGATGVTYTTTAISNGDKIDVVMTSTETCRSANTVPSSQITMAVNAALVPSVTTAASATTICAGTSVTFTAAPTNGGSPSYQWRRNATIISGATGVTYATSTISNGDKFDVVMASTETCRTTNTAPSSQITMVVNTSVMPSVSAVASATTICSGASVKFTATPTHGGSPTYQWRRNNANISGATGVTYTTTAISNGDKIDVVMTSTETCRSANTVPSSQITMAVNAALVPSVTASSSATTICAGTSVTFTATPTNGGSPSYQWRRNATIISGATGVTYATSTISNGDKFDVVMTSTETCRTTNTAPSSQITMVVNTSVMPSVSAVASATTICSGASVKFTATPTHGGSPTYQWRRNNANISGATGVTYTTTAISNGDKIDVVMASTANCRSVNSANSAQITMSISSSLTASVSITASPSNTVYEGQEITFTAIPVNGGASPSFQWKKNGTIISGATSAVYKTTLLATGDAISVSMISNSTCVASPNVSSSNIVVTVNPNPIFGSSISGPTGVTTNQNNVTYSVTNEPGMSYVWTVPPGATIVSGQNTNSIVVDFGTSSGNVSVTQTKPNGESSTISTSVSVGTTTPIEIGSAATIVSLYPVPCNDHVTIDMNVSNEIVITYMLIDATGNVVRVGEINYQGAPVSIQTDVAAGIYQLILQWDGKSAMKKFIRL